MPHPSGADPRPLTGEPLAIDLLNTRWIDGDGPHDLLDSVSGLAVWLDSPRYGNTSAPTPPPTRPRWTGCSWPARRSTPWPPRPPSAIRPPPSRPPG